MFWPCLMGLKVIKCEVPLNYSHQWDSPLLLTSTFFLALALWPGGLDLDSLALAVGLTDGAEAWLERAFLWFCFEGWVLSCAGDGSREGTMDWTPYGDSSRRLLLLLQTKHGLAQFVKSCLVLFWHLCGEDNFYTLSWIFASHSWHGF